MAAILTSTVVATSSAESRLITWGRQHKAGWASSLGALAMVVCCPILTIVYWITLEKYEGSLTHTASAFFQSDDPLALLSQHLPQPSLKASVGYVSWLALQALLFMFLPGSACKGQRTPGGHLLHYTANGLNAWCVTHLLALGLTLKALDPAMIAKHWEGLLVAVNVYGIGLAVVSQLKGYFVPSFVQDRKVSGSLVFDFWAGVELNPRLGDFDIKFFHNTRPGIVAWTLIDLSWAAYQYQNFGYVTKSMAIVIGLHAIYVLDLFYNESWYTRTPDISHDHFGFYLAWGDTVFLPTFYTLQTQYLARYPTHLSNIQAVLLATIGLTGYCIFRSANSQRDYVRSSGPNDKATIWGRPATYIPCTYYTIDGKRHQTILLTCGWWGTLRHANYLADLVLSWAMCATCGFSNVLGWSYFFFMCVFLTHRLARDDRRCRNKYGAQWTEYCKAVPYCMIPFVF